MKEIVFASSNKGKIAELEHFLAPHKIDVVSQDDLGVGGAIEDGKTFIENAILKARHVAQYTELPVLADDSGIMIAELDGEPGIYSARYAGPKANSKDNIAKVIAKLAQKNIQNSPAMFCCVLALFESGAQSQLPEIFTGTWEGSVINTPRGEHGFGYDPIFLDPKSNKTAAEIGDFAKQSYSHRAKALQKLLAYLLVG